MARHFSPEEAEKAFRLFVSWSVRFLIYGGRGGMLDQQYSLRAQDVGTKKLTKARDLRNAMEKYVPTDKEFQEAFSTARVSRPHSARYYLRALEKSLKKLNLTMVFTWEHCHNNSGKLPKLFCFFLSAKTASTGANTVFATF